MRATILFRHRKKKPGRSLQFARRPTLDFKSSLAVPNRPAATTARLHHQPNSSCKQMHTTRAFRAALPRRPALSSTTAVATPAARLISQTSHRPSTLSSPSPMNFNFFRNFFSSPSSQSVAMASQKAQKLIDENPVSKSTPPAHLPRRCRHTPPSAAPAPPMLQQASTKLHSLIHVVPSGVLQVLLPLLQGHQEPTQLPRRRFQGRRA